MFNFLGILLFLQTSLLFGDEEKISSKLSTIVDKKGNVAKTKLNEFAFDIIKKGIEDNNTLLVVGGIQG
ncbi:MAG: hypothetical protein RBT59_03175, partial [Arcobacteraceae bacterium]|nr:hypothetical protein [Arcobacteraceae bacterium]